MACGSRRIEAKLLAISIQFLYSPSVPQRQVNRLLTWRIMYAENAGILRAEIFFFLCSQINKI